MVGKANNSKTVGYRCPELNAAVRGSKTSQHMKGEAADIDTGDRQQNKLLFEYNPQEPAL